MSGPREPREGDPGAFDPPAPDVGRGGRPDDGPRLLRRGPWEMAASVLIGLGVVMLMQPFAMVLYTYSFAVILTGTVMFLIVSHFPD